MALRIATFNLENLDDEPPQPSLAQRIAVTRPQLLRARADILCLQEIHSQRDQQNNRVLSALEELLHGTPYAGFNRETTRTVGNDLYHERNLVILSRFAITDVRIHRDSDGPRPRYQMATARPADSTADPVEWERPILHVQVDLGGNRTLHVMNVHLKSKLASSIPGRKIDSYTWESVSAWAEGSFLSSLKRVGQALQVRLIVDDIFDTGGEGALVAVCGDFNADTHEVPVRAICGPVEETGNPAHGMRVLAPCENNIAESSRYSLIHLGKGEMIDHILVSRALLATFDHAEIHNEILPDESGAFRTDRKFPEPDHAPVIAEFNIV